MIGVVVSQANDCAYCVRHHAEALNFYWKDEKKTNAFGKDFTAVTLPETDLVLCHYADNLTRSPNTADNPDRVAVLQESGLSDRAILDATLVVAYFNFVNRIVQGLGVNLEDDGGSGYEY